MIFYHNVFLHQFAIFYSILLIYIGFTQPRDVYENETWPKTRVFHEKLIELRNAPSSSSKKSDYCRTPPSVHEWVDPIEIVETHTNYTFNRSLFTWTMRTTAQRSPLQKSTNIALIIVESLRYIDLSEKFGLLMRELINSSRAFHTSNVLRIGTNSMPNRCPLLSGQKLSKRSSCNKSKSTNWLHKLASKNGLGVFIGDTIGENTHKTNMIRLMFENISRESMLKNSNTLLKQWCSPDPQEKCISLPIPVNHENSKNWHTSCSGVSLHEFTFRKFLSFMQSSESVVGLINFYDYHPPHLHAYSADMEEAITSFVVANSDTDIFIVGDHGHGIDGGGSAGAIFVPKSSRGNVTCFDKILTTHSIYTYIANIIRSKDMCSPPLSNWRTWYDPGLIDIVMPESCSNVSAYNIVASKEVTSTLSTCASYHDLDNDVHQVKFHLVCDRSQTTIDVRIFSTRCFATPSTTYSKYWRCAQKELKHPSWLNISVVNNKVCAIHLNGKTEMPVGEMHVISLDGH